MSPDVKQISAPSCRYLHWRGGRAHRAWAGLPAAAGPRKRVALRPAPRLTPSAVP